MFRRIYSFELEGKAALGFDTGLDSRAFAQARFVQFITEPGLIARPDGTIETWKASGVVERGGGTERPASMVIWGPPFAGERLDLLVNDSARQNEALTALIRWIEARILLGEQSVSPGKFAALIAGNASSGGSGAYPAGTVFFAPENLSLRCIQAEGGKDRINGGERYVHPDLSGVKAAAFTASAMLYRVLAGAEPFSAEEASLLREDMREGNFPPVRFAAPGLDERLGRLIQTALSPTGKTSATADGGTETASALLSQLLAMLKASTGAASLFHSLSAEEIARITKEKERFLKRKNLTIKTRRFVIRNTAIIAGSAAAILITFLVARSIVKGRADGPTTAGMNAEQVIQSYYGAFGELDHPLMEACALKRAGKDDIEMVVNLFVITKVRQAYETGSAPPLISASKWKESGGPPVDSQVFGVTDLEIKHLSGNEDSEEIRRRVVYTLWLPWQRQDGEDGALIEQTGRLPEGVYYIDELTLVKHKGNWRIAEINRLPR
jgi:hypothetical protein